MAHGNGWSRIGEASSKIGEALMRVAMLSDDRRHRADQLARQGRLDVMAMQRIDMDEQMLAQSVQRTEELTRQGGTRDARAAAGIAWERGREGYTPDLGEGGTMAEFLTGLGQGTPQPWDFDATQSEAYLDRGAANTQAQVQARALAEIQTEGIGERATTLGEQGLTVGGQPLPEDRGGPESRAGMFEAGGRWFKDDPVGQAEGIAWLEQIGAVGGGGDDLFKGVDLGQLGVGGGRPEDEGGNWLGNVWDAVRGRGGEPEQETMGTMGTPGTMGMPGQLPAGEPVGPMGTPGTPLMEDSGLPPRGGLPSGVTQDQIDQLREMGFTEDQIREWLSNR
jgi:hypothetical protein